MRIRASLAAVLALFPAGRALAAPSALQGLLAVTLLLLPVPIGLQALKRDQVAMALQAISHPPSRDEALAILRQERIRSLMLHR